MKFFKIVFFGPQQSGKTELIKCLRRVWLAGDEEQSPFYNFAEEYFSTRGLALTTLHYKTPLLHFCEVAGAPILPESFIENYYQDAEIGVYCIDLTEEMDLRTVEKDLANFKKVNPHATLYIVGTKADCCLQKNFTSQFAEIIKKLPQPISCQLITSAKTHLQARELLNLLFTERFTRALADLYKAVEKLPLIEDNIKKQGNALLKDLSDSTLDLLKKAKKIEEFTTYCSPLLENFHEAMEKGLFVVQIATIALTLFSGLLFTSPVLILPGAVITSLSLCTQQFFNTKNSSAQQVLQRIGVSHSGNEPTELSQVTPLRTS